MRYRRTQSLTYCGLLGKLAISTDPVLLRVEQDRVIRFSDKGMQYSPTRLGKTKGVPQMWDRPLYFIFAVIYDITHISSALIAVVIDDI